MSTFAALAGALLLAPASALGAKVNVTFDKNSGIELKDQIFIALCKSKPGAKGCVERANKCRATRGAWQGYQAKFCPALLSKAYGEGGGGGRRAVAPRRGGKPGTARLLDAVEAECPTRPDHKTCRQFRQLCRDKYGTATPRAQQVCDGLGWGPGGTRDKEPNSFAAHRNWSLRLMSYDDAPVWQGATAVGLLRAQYGAIDTTSAASLDMELQVGAELGGEDTNMMFESLIHVGFGTWAGRNYGIALLAGAGYGGLKNHAPGAWLGTVEALAVLYPTRTISAAIRARAYWLFTDDSPRKRGSTSLSFADEFALQAHVYLGARTDIPTDQTANRWFAGLEMREIQDSRWLGLTVGFGYAQQ